MAAVPKEAADKIVNKQSTVYKLSAKLIADLEARPGAHWFQPSVDRRDTVRHFLAYALMNHCSLNLSISVVVIIFYNDPLISSYQNADNGPGPDSGKPSE